MYIKDGENKDYGAGKYYLYYANDLILGKTEEDIINSENLSHNPDYPDIFAFGWLGDKVEDEYNLWTDETAKNLVLIKLAAKKSYEYCLDQFCGWHDCEICGQKNDYSFSGSIKIKYMKKVFVCPCGIEHYIDKHDYRPPDDAVNAILYGDYITHKTQARDCFELHSEEIYAKVEEIKQMQKEEREKSEKRKIEVQSQGFKDNLQRAMNDVIPLLSIEEEEKQMKEFMDLFESRKKLINDMTEFFKRNEFFKGSIKKEDVLKMNEYENEWMDHRVILKMNRKLYKEQNPIFEKDDEEQNNVGMENNKTAKD